MERELTEIDRLIEEGLTLYGQGDLDGALLQWEEALALDPENPQANSYVDYVRANYDLLTGEVNGEGGAEAPFGIADDDPEYQIEIQPGELPASQPQFSAADPVDEGWYLDETQDTSGAFRGPPGIDLGGDASSTPADAEQTAQGVMLELEAEEPPLPGAPAEAAEVSAEAEGVSFDDATREYSAKQHRPPEPAAAVDDEAGRASEFAVESTPGFGDSHDFNTPPGFGTQITDVRRRDLGFVQPTAAGEQVKQWSALEAFDREMEPAPAAAAPAPAPDGDAPGGPPALAADMAMDLISSLPSPRPAPSVPQIEIQTPLSGSLPPESSPGSRDSTTRDFPHPMRKPATSDLKPSVGGMPTQDFESKTMERIAAGDRTREIPVVKQAAAVADPVVSAPTRDLGLRDAAALAAVGDGTRADVVLPFDPIDARAAEILEEIDEGAPVGEAREDESRRRITALFERASLWSSGGDYERAVAAIDLAMSEDPNSALAQKLIQRNRETIMSVFQTYLGPLDRQPQLARPLHELASAPISPRAAFLLSRIDGLISIDEILDVCGMPRLEAYRYLSQLYLRGILR